MATVFGQRVEEYAEPEDVDPSELAAQERARMLAATGGVDLFGPGGNSPADSAPAPATGASSSGAGPGSAVAGAIRNSDRVKVIPIESIYTDPDNFQFREVDPGRGYSEHHVSNLVSAWDRRKADPIKVAEYPVGSGKFVVIAGHHRFAAAQRVGEKDLDAEILGADVGNPDTPAGREALIAAAVESNFRDKGETLAGKVGAFRALRGLQRNRRRGDADILAKDLPSIDAQDRRLILALDKLPDEVVSDVSRNSQYGAKIYEPHAQALGEMVERHDWPPEQANRLWQGLKAKQEADAGNALLPLGVWRKGLVKVSGVDAGKQDGLFGDQYDFSVALSVLEESENRLSVLNKQERGLSNLVKQCIDEPGEAGIDTGALRPILHAKLDYTRQLQTHEQKLLAAAVADKDLDSVGPPPEEPEILRQPSRANEAVKAMVADEVQEIDQLVQAAEPAATEPAAAPRPRGRRRKAEPEPEPVSEPAPAPVVESAPVSLYVPPMKEQLLEGFNYDREIPVRPPWKSGRENYLVQVDPSIYTPDTHGQVAELIRAAGGELGKYNHLAQRMMELSPEENARLQEMLPEGIKVVPYGDQANAMSLENEISAMSVRYQAARHHPVMGPPDEPQMGDTMADSVKASTPPAEWDYPSAEDTERAMAAMRATLERERAKNWPRGPIGESETPPDEAPGRGPANLGELYADQERKRKAAREYRAAHQRFLVQEDFSDSTNRRDNWVRNVIYGAGARTEDEGESFMLHPEKLDAVRELLPEGVSLIPYTEEAAAERESRRQEHLAEIRRLMTPATTYAPAAPAAPAAPVVIDTDGDGDTDAVLIPAPDSAGAPDPAPQFGGQSNLGADFATNRNLGMFDLDAMPAAETTPLADPAQLKARQERRDLLDQGQQDIFASDLDGDGEPEAVIVSSEPVSVDTDGDGDKDVALVPAPAQETEDDLMQRNLDTFMSGADANAPPHPAMDSVLDDVDSIHSGKLTPEQQANVTAVDVDGDGEPEAVVVAVADEPAKPAKPARRRKSAPPPAANVVPVDVDQDGTPDTAVVVVEASAPPACPTPPPLLTRREKTPNINIDIEVEHPKVAATRRSKSSAPKVPKPKTAPKAGKVGKEKASKIKQRAAAAACAPATPKPKAKAKPKPKRRTNWGRW